MQRWHGLAPSAAKCLNCLRRTSEVDPKRKDNHLFTPYGPVQEHFDHQSCKCRFRFTFISVDALNYATSVL